MALRFGPSTTTDAARSKVLCQACSRALLLNAEQAEVRIRSSPSQWTTCLAPSHLVQIRCDSFRVRRRIWAVFWPELLMLDQLRSQAASSLEFGLAGAKQWTQLLRERGEGERRGGGGLASQCAVF